MTFEITSAFQNLAQKDLFVKPLRQKKFASSSLFRGREHKQLFVSRQNKRFFHRFRKSRHRPDQRIQPVGGFGTVQGRVGTHFLLQILKKAHMVDQFLLVKRRHGFGTEHLSPPGTDRPEGQSGGKFPEHCPDLRPEVQSDP